MFLIDAPARGTAHWTMARVALSRVRKKRRPVFDIVATHRESRSPLQTS